MKTLQSSGDPSQTNGRSAVGRPTTATNLSPNLSSSLYGVCNLAHISQMTPKLGPMITEVAGFWNQITPFRPMMGYRGRYPFFLFFWTREASAGVYRTGGTMGPGSRGFAAWPG